MADINQEVQPVSMPITRTIVLAVAAILFADFALTLNDALVNMAQGELGLASVFWLRALVAVPLLVGLLIVQRARMWPQFPVVVIVRSALLLISWAALYASFKYLPLANAVATAYTNPIMIAVAAMVLEKQRITGRVWAAIVLGFAGAIMIVQPGAGTLDWAYVLPITAAASYSAAMILTNRYLQSESPQTISLWLNLAFLLGGLFGVLALGGNPVAVATTVFSINPFPFVVMGILVAVAGVAVAFAFQNAPPPWIATFDYSYLLFSILWSFVFFGQIPNALAILGMGLVACAGVLVLFRRS